jgi:hypothetical protein
MVLAYHYGYRMSELDWASAAGRRAIGILRHIELRCSQIKERRLALMTCFAYAQSKAANGCGSSSSGVNAAMVAMSKLPARFDPHHCGKHLPGQELASQPPKCASSISDHALQYKEGST